MKNGKIYKISKSEKYYASISKDRKPRVIQWLRENKHSGLIRNEIVADVGKGKDAVAEEIMTYIKNAGLEVIREENIHTGSFKALVKEDIEKGKDVPLEVLSQNLKSRLEVKNQEV